MDPVTLAIANNRIGVVSVKDYGAKGDGVSNDAEAIQKALDYAESIGGAIVLMPPGRYMLEKTILVGENTTLWGSGRATILSSSAPTRDGLMVSNKGYDSPGYTGAGNMTIGNFAIDADAAALGVAHAQNVVFEKIWGIDCAWHYFDICASRNVILRDFELRGTSTHIRSMVQIDCAESPNVYSVYDGESLKTTLGDGTRAHNVLVMNGYIDANGKTGVDLHNTIGGDYITIQNVDIENCDIGINSKRPSNWNYITIKDVRINGAATRGINLRNPVDVGEYNKGLHIQNVRIENAPRGGILVQNWKDVKIENVTVSGVETADEAGFILLECVDGVIRECSSSGASSTYGVKLEQYVRYFHIDRCSFAGHSLGIKRVTPGASVTFDNIALEDVPTLTDFPIPPTVGWYRKGDRLPALDPATEGYVGYICVETGSPGVWKPYGAIEV